MTILSTNRPLRLTPVAMHEMVMQENFSPGIISRLSERQKAKLRRFIRARLPHCNSRERKVFSARLAMLAPDADLKQDSWEYHHANVCMAIQGYLHEQAMMPTQAVLAAKTGYSRQTINKHLKAYREHPSYIEQAEIMRLMRSKVSEKMLSMALQGDIRAAKVFMDTAYRAERGSSQFHSCLPSGTQLQREILSPPERMPLVQNNFIRINGLFITEEKLNGLRPEQLAQLEELLELKEEQKKVFTLNAMGQKDSDPLLVRGLQTGTDVNPNDALNPLNISR